MDHLRPGGEMKRRDPAQPTASQLLPLGSAWQELLTKAYFWPGVIACLGVTALWASLRARSTTVDAVVNGITIAVPIYYLVVGLLLTAAGAYAIYRMAGKPKAWWLMPVVIAAVALLTDTPLMSWLQVTFRLIGPIRDDDSVIGGFAYNLFRAGLPEELLKAIPVLVGVYLGKVALEHVNRKSPAHQLSVVEPLDGLIIGAAAGFGFAFTETLFDYVPRFMLFNREVIVGMIAVLKTKGLTVQLPAGELNVQKVILDLYAAMVKAMGPDGAQQALHKIIVRNPSAGLELLLPRLLGNFFGHAAYAGVFGYFIGLAAMVRTQKARTVLTGLAIACSLHAAWNAAASKSSLAMFAIALMAFVMLAVCVIKARQISPERSQLMASQLVGTAHTAPAMATASPPGVPTFDRTAAAQRAEHRDMPAPAAVGGALARAATPAAGSITWDDESSLRMIEVGTARVPATVGARLWERQVPGITSSRGDGVVAEVSANPADPAVLGLKNLSLQTWIVTLPHGQTRELASGRSIRLEPGMRLALGEMVVQIR